MSVRNRNILLTKKYFRWIIVACMAHGILQSLSVIFVLMTTKWRGLSFCVLIASILFFHSLFTTTILDYSMTRPLQQILLISIYYIGMRTFFETKVEDIQSLWEIYMKFSYWVSVFGVFQLISLIFLNVDPFEFLWSAAVSLHEMGATRLHSFLGEPGVLATFLIPSVCYSILKYKYVNKKEFYIILFVFLMTFSAAALVAFGVFILYMLLKSKYRIIPMILAPLFILSILFIYLQTTESEKETNTNKPFMIFKDLGEIQFLSSSPENFEILGASVYATTANAWVAFNAPLRLIGTGIGTHPYSYVRLYPETNSELYGLNKEDAYSMGTRIYSEFGFIGILLYFLFIFRNMNTKDPINMSIFFYILTMTIRGGHYADNGIFFFFFIYYLTSSSKKHRFTFNVSNTQTNIYVQP